MHLRLLQGLMILSVMYLASTSSQLNKNGGISYERIKNNFRLEKHGALFSQYIANNSCNYFYDGRSNEDFRIASRRSAKRRYSTLYDSGMDRRSSCRIWWRTDPPWTIHT